MKTKLFFLTFLCANFMLAKSFETNLPPLYSISYNSPGCIFAGSTVFPVISENGGGGLPLGIWTATPAGLTIDSDTGVVNAGASQPGTYTIKFSAGVNNFVTAGLTLRPLNTPTFNLISNLCQNSIPPSLPTTSTNGIVGTWFPATINTAALGQITYVFTPNNFQCGIATTLNIIISSPTTTPTFNIPTSFCKNAILASLPTTSINGVSGSWSSPTINTAVVGQSTYVFTGTGTCVALYNLLVTITQPIVPNFQDINVNNNYQTMSPLLTTSPNGITGVWDPVTVNTSQSGSYTFTPTAGQCAAAKTISITFDYPAGSEPPVLQACNNGNGFGTFSLTDNNPFINPSTSNMISIVYFSTVANAQAEINILNNTSFVNFVPFNQTIFAKITNLANSSRPYRVVAVPLQVVTNLQPVATASGTNLNIYVDANNNVLRTLTLSTIVQGNNNYNWRENNVPLGGNSVGASYVINNYNGMSPRTFNAQVAKSFTTNCLGISNNIIVGTIRVGSPLGNISQTFNQGQTLANLVVTGTNIRWYSTAVPSPATLLPPTTVLTTFTNYYASQTIDGIESPTTLNVIAILNTLATSIFDRNELKFSPNPVVDFLNIQSQESVKNISIFNMLGQQVYDQKFNNSEVKLDLSLLFSGTYLIKVESDNKQMVSKLLKK